MRYKLLLVGTLVAAVVLMSGRGAPAPSAKADIGAPAPVASMATAAGEDYDYIYLPYQVPHSPCHSCASGLSHTGFGVVDIYKDYYDWADPACWEGCIYSPNSPWVGTQYSAGPCHDSSPLLCPWTGTFRVYGYFDTSPLIGETILEATIITNYKLAGQSQPNVVVGFYKADWGTSWVCMDDPEYLHCAGQSQWNSAQALLFSQMVSSTDWITVDGTNPQYAIDTNLITPGQDFQFFVRSANEQLGSVADVLTPVLAVKVERKSLPPVLLVHGWRGGSETWSTLTQQLDAEGIPYYIFDYSPGTGDPKEYAQALKQWIQQLRTDTGYEGKFDIVAHSMGAMVSRWYMEKLGGATDVRQWIGVAPVNHGAAIADMLHFFMDTLNKLLFFLPGDLDGSEPAVQAMQTKSPILAQLNYDEPDFNLSKWKTVPETLAPGVTYRNLVGINSAGEPSFSPATAGKTRVVKKDGEGKRYPYWTFQGDGVVPLYLSQLQGVETDCFEGAAHVGITADSQVIDRIVLYIEDPSSPSLDNCPTSDPQDDHQATGKGNRGILPRGEYQTIDVPIDSSVEKATVMTTWQGSELGLTLTSPSAEVMQPGVYPVVEYWEGGDSIWYVIDLPEPGVWTARIDAVDVPDEGEPYTFMTFYSTPLTLEVKTAEGTYSFDAGESATVVASLVEGEVPITGASVGAEVMPPDGSADEITLYDDGSHGDALANDGDYTNVYPLGAVGDYDFTVHANGGTAGPFERTDFMTLWVEGTAVGGVAEPPDVAAAAGGSSSPPYAALAGAAAGVVVLAAGGWCARRRRRVRRET